MQGQIEITSTVTDLNETKLSKLIAEHQARRRRLTPWRLRWRHTNHCNEKTDEQDAIALLEAAISQYYKENKIEMREIEGSVKLLAASFHSIRGSGTGCHIC